MKAGWKVKIEDIGPLATIIQSGNGMVELDLEGVLDSKGFGKSCGKRDHIRGTYENCI